MNLFSVHNLVLSWSLLSLVSAEASVVSSNLDLLVKHGLSRRDGEQGADFRMVRCVCVAALKMAPRRASAEDALPPAR